MATFLAAVEHAGVGRFGAVTSSAVGWVIFRPSGLFDREGVADYVVSDARAEGRLTARSSSSPPAAGTRACCR